jgi:hypothetical protein
MWVCCGGLKYVVMTYATGYKTHLKIGVSHLGGLWYRVLSRLIQTFRRNILFTSSRSNEWKDDAIRLYSQVARKAVTHIRGRGRKMEAVTFLRNVDVHLQCPLVPRRLQAEHSPSLNPEDIGRGHTKETGNSNSTATALPFPQFALLHSVPCVQLRLITILGNCGCQLPCYALGLTETAVKFLTGQSGAGMHSLCVSGYRGLG